MNLGDLLLSQKKHYFYLMHLSYGNIPRERKRLWNYAQIHNLIGLDLPDIVKKDWFTLSEEERQVARSTWIRQFDLFCKEMKTGDYVVVLNGTLALLGIGKITEPRHHYDKELTSKRNTGFFNHVRKVDWKVKYEYGGFALPKPIKGFNNTLSKVTPNGSYWETLTKINL